MAKDKDKRVHSVHVTLGSSNHTDTKRSDNDFYATPPSATRNLLELETFSTNVWEPCCGMGHIASELEKKGYSVKKTDIFDYGCEGCLSGEDYDFLRLNETYDGDIITNPPYGLATEFAEHALDIITTGHKVAMFLKIQFLETQKRYELFKKYPPKIIYVSVRRYGCSADGKFLNGESSSAVCYCWFVWEKGFQGDPVIKWFNYKEYKEAYELF